MTRQNLAMLASKAIRLPWLVLGRVAGLVAGRAPLRIAVSAADLSPGVGGVGNYTISLLRGWARWQPESPVAIFCTKESFAAIQRLPLPARLRHFYLDGEEKIPDHGGEFDLIYYPMGRLALVPPPRLCAFQFADLQDYFFPENFTEATLSRRRNSYRSVKAYVDGILVPSEFTRESLVSLLGIDRERVHVIPLPVADLPAQATRPAGLAFERFVYYPADDYPHKNHERLLQALGLIKLRGGKIPLVCTGGRGAGAKLEEIAAAHGVSGQFIHLGKISREEVRWLYEHTEMLVFPSLCEGFGLPVVEAFSCGAPVVCSGVTSLPEVGGGAAVYCNPFDAADIAEKISLVWSDPPLRADLAARGHARSGEFRTRDIIKAHHDTFAAIIARGKSAGNFSPLAGPDERKACDLYTGRAHESVRKSMPACISRRAVRTVSGPLSGADLPVVHFFTIVLNGMPFLPRQAEIFEKLPVRWHWHVIEGVAELMHDTAWSKARGGRILATRHSGGLSIDGTTAYLDELSARSPNVTVYRKPGFWSGKVEMINAPLANVTEGCLLWQIDVDEFWTPAQIIRMAGMFAAERERSGAQFYCRYFVSPRHVLDNIGSYGNNPREEWRRVWRFQPGDRWASHEPPQLVRGNTGDVMAMHPFLHDETLGADLVFDHLAYCTEGQVRFKEEYYGYSGALEKWKRMVESDHEQFLAKEYLDWIKDPVWALKTSDDIARQILTDAQMAEVR